MNLDKILLIPHLSKELNLIGYKKLPFRSKTKFKKKKAKETHSDSDSENDNGNVEIVFDSRKMICQLVTVCIDLVNNVKSRGFNGCDNDQLNKLNFENAKLERQLNMTKKEVEMKVNELKLQKEQNRQLNEKIQHLEKNVSEKEIEKKKLIQNSTISENLLKHSLKKQEAAVQELHTLIWKQFNMADKNYFPENFEVVQIQQPDFNKLWSDVKYSSLSTKEDVLKKAVCIFQENNNLLMEDNHFLKRLLFVTLEEINESMNFICDKMQLTKGCKVTLSDKVSEIFKNVEDLNVQMYRRVINKHFDIVKRAAELFDEASFSISEDLFVCWSDIIQQIKSLVSDLKS